MRHSPHLSARRHVLQKAPTGIHGIDEITNGGLPRGRPTLVCGSAGCGKTLLAMEFLIHGALEYAEPGVFIAFEETADELTRNVASLGYDLELMGEQNQLVVETIHVDRSEIEETGEYDLEGLFIRIGFAIDSIGAQRIVLDTIEALFSSFANEAILRAELRRLFRWLKERGVTAIVTAERGNQALTRHGLEEYVADCVILLDHRVDDEISTRRLRMVKYRGSTHGTNEYPFFIGEHGITVLPLTSASLEYEVGDERISTGVAQLDEMLGGPGIIRGSSMLISGTAGSGKTSLIATFVDAACRRGERCLFMSFEESVSQICRNMRSIGIDLVPWIDQGLLRFSTQRPTAYGLELHLMSIIEQVHTFQPRVVVLDPITNFSAVGTTSDVKAMLVRLFDLLKSQDVTLCCTSLTEAGGDAEHTDVGVSSLMDTWILLRNIETHGERNRGLYILKSRGIAHSNQVREMIMTSEGIKLVDVYLGTGMILTGSARLLAEAQAAAELAQAEARSERRARDVERRRRVIAAQIAALEAELAADEALWQEEARQEAIERRISQTLRHSLRQERHSGMHGEIPSSQVRLDSDD
ncbi:MAG TPA: circadian clock protein KaiC [Roseiflexaceae bacterium]|nr:circadian clock protein KaiC [Roseiflexaceae bacterium]HMP41028.1 circadian clock protein KaiC [Roseiflexaceae bacterium]